MSSLAKRPSERDGRVFNYARKLTTQARAIERSRASARAKVRDKGQAKIRGMGPGLRLRRPVTVASPA